MTYDVILVGGGPAGLNAALVLGRCRRRCLLCHSGPPENHASHALHGYLSRDGIAPHKLLHVGLEEVAAYPSIEIVEDEVVDATTRGDGFEVVLRGGERKRSRKLLLATGLFHPLPDVPHIEHYYGRSAFHCPYCDGWEMRDRPLAVLGQGEAGAHFALELLLWSRDLVLCTNGPANLSLREQQRLDRHHIALREQRIVRLEGEDGILRRLVFADGSALERNVLFFHSEPRQHSLLPEKLGCKRTQSGGFATRESQGTRVPGLYVAGDATGGTRMAILAAAEGARAAVALNTELLKEDLA